MFQLLKSDRVGEPIASIKIDIKGAEYVVLDAWIVSGRLGKIGKTYVDCHADRFEGLQEAKNKTLAVEDVEIGWP